MTGRHRPGQVAGDAPARPSGKSRRRPSILIGATVLLAIATVAVVIALVTGGSSAHHGTASGPGKGCAIGMPVQVIVDPAIAPAVHSITHAWEGSRPAVDGLCINVSMAIQDSNSAEQALITNAETTLWIPDSSVWPSRLLADAPTLVNEVTTVRTIASSPVVLATTPGHVRSLAASSQRGWISGLGGSPPVELPDPTNTAEGSLALLALHSQASTTSSDALAATYLQLAAHTVASPDDGLQALRASPASAPAVVASEQQVLAAEHAAPGQLTAVYPHGPAPALDFPLVSVARSPTADYQNAVRQLANALTAPEATPALAAVGLRDSAGTPIQKAAQGLGAQPVQLAPAATTQSLTTSIRLWASARTSQRLLAVIDVSGSMKDSAGNGQSKIQLASEAGVAAMTFVPDSWSVGLWSFSQHAAPSDDWTELVPVSPVTSARPDLVSAARSLPGLVGGNTGLYDTALAAFENVRSHYEPGKVNSVLLMTDGANLDPGGTSLSTLLTTLRAEYSSARPVHIITIALGQDADVGALRAISAATGSATNVVSKPADVRTVFLRSILGSS
jgi:hypothetical protein